MFIKIFQNWFVRLSRYLQRSLCRMTRIFKRAYQIWTVSYEAPSVVSKRRVASMHSFISSLIRSWGQCFGFRAFSIWEPLEISIKLQNAFGVLQRKCNHVSANKHFIWSWEYNSWTWEFLFAEKGLFEISQNKSSSKITRYMVYDMQKLAHFMSILYYHFLHINSLSVIFAISVCSYNFRI